MSNDNIPDTDHVVRYCSPRHVQNGNITESAFELRGKDNHLSANWLEYFNSGKRFLQQLECVRKTIKETITLRQNGRFAKINVGESKNKIPDLQIKHIPEKTNPSHAGISISGDENRQWTLELANTIQPDDVFPALK